MDTKSKPPLPGLVAANVRCRLDGWRRTRPKRGPMPAELWKEAADLARLHGINPVAQALCLNYYSLKRHLNLVVRNTPSPQAASRPAFVELAVVPSAQTDECRVELERTDGARMKLWLSRQTDLLELVESFWRCRP